MDDLLQQIRGRLVVSCQPVTGGPLDRPDIVAALALAALAGGAAGLRIEGVANLLAVRAATLAPVIGLVKRDLDGSGVRITPWLEDVDALAAAGAEVIAVDATDRPRPVPVVDLIGRVRGHGRIAMADCATAGEGAAARAAGAAILGSTLSGYTGGPVPEEPDLALVAALRRVGGFVVAEGRYNAPGQAARARQAGADAVVVGSAITRPEVVTGWFRRAVEGAAP
jgi:putative N-acetylmannosamine-6-phosphate epimerase